MRDFAQVPERDEQVAQVVEPRTAEQFLRPLGVPPTTPFFALPAPMDVDDDPGNEPELNEVDTANSHRL